ncbi:hypothetical protein ASE04_21115 [Rhizobium sp. Root708]|uniref:hypothetical protein n=1 Tax=Rhizobium sp. Root708 TaxID=1736592 RepID=UPI0006FD71EB|nr:hypothetical protein [Rhizobium sp. Root708]KRB61373.1 hypothetical protein ASE04_21115 [Rhizobium sp. Root708]
MKTDASEKVPVSERFFAIDRNVWSRICDLGLNEAVCYVVIAAGAGRSHTVSNWSAEAIEKRTGMHHVRAKEAIGRLVEHDFMTVTPKGKLRRYDLNISVEPAFIWLPLSIVEGAAGERSPVRILRQAQDINALRLFVDLYFFHDLDGNGGCEWRPGVGIRIPYQREIVGAYGPYTLWRFDPIPSEQGGIVISAYQDAKFIVPDFWGAWRMLRRAGFVDFVEHLVDADSLSGEVYHPLPMGRHGEPGEQAITNAALAAGRRMMSWHVSEDAVIIPVEDLKPNIQLIGVARLLYKPHTKQTKAWFGRTGEWAKIASAFGEMASGIKGASDSGIKDNSRKAQGEF